MTHSINYRVYYEDTDAGGVVYYANYLKFAERARTEWLRALGFNQSELWNTHGMGIVVGRAEVLYKKPARLDDVLTIESQLQSLSKARMSMNQNILRNGELLAEVSVDLVCVSNDIRPKAWPADVASKFTINP